MFRLVGMLRLEMVSELKIVSSQIMSLSVITPLLQMPLFLKTSKLEDGVVLKEHLLMTRLARI